MPADNTKAKGAVSTMLTAALPPLSRCANALADARRRATGYDNGFLPVFATTALAVAAAIPRAAADGVNSCAASALRVRVRELVKYAREYANGETDLKLAADANAFADELNAAYTVLAERYSDGTALAVADKSLAARAIFLTAALARREMATANDYRLATAETATRLFAVAVATAEQVITPATANEFLPRLTTVSRLLADGVNAANSLAAVNGCRQLLTAAAELVPSPTVKRRRVKPSADRGLV